MPSIAGGAGAMERLLKLVISCLIDCGGPSREWWAVFGTVTEAFEGFGLEDFEAKEEDGKCLFLYFRST